MRSNSRVNYPPPLGAQLAQNILLERQLWLRRQLDPRRDLDFECGHPLEITREDYKNFFLRGDIAHRVVAVLPEESWATRPQVFETEDESMTAFETAWIELEETLSILPILQRADVLSGIGRYGILLLGLDDGQPLNVPVMGIDEKGEKVGTSTHQLLYLRPFDEACLDIAKFEEDVTNPRYGFPTIYRIQFEETLGSAQKTITGDVHWSRVIHLADNRTSSDVYGLPRMQKVFNRLLDVRKIAGGSGEMFWKGGFPGLSMEAQVAPDEQVEIDLPGTKKQMEAYMNGLQRYIATVGMTAKSLSVQVADPVPHLEVQIRLIANALGVPWRVFMGSEAAQLASEQDTISWNRRLNRRREGYLGPYVIRPLLERLIAFGVLPEPQKIVIDWTDLNTPSDKGQAEVAQLRTDALSKYVQGGVDILIPPFHYLTLILGLDDKEARSILDEAGTLLRDEDKGGEQDQAPPNDGDTANPPSPNQPS